MYFLRMIFSYIIFALFACTTIMGLTEVGEKDLKMRYLLYDINYGEGFNLRRDVFIRMANTVRFLNKKENWTLVLPPFGRVYHWFSSELTALPWSDFFDLEKLRLFVPVIEFYEFIEEFPDLFVDQVYYLQHIPLGDDNRWEERTIPEPCKNDHHGYYKEGDAHTGWFFGFEGVRTKKFGCVSIQSDPLTFAKFLLDPKAAHAQARSIMLDRAETVIHGMYSEWSAEYWTGRRSMVFAKRLRARADHFRETALNSTDITDHTVPPEGYDWRYPWSLAPARGGPYLGVHLRRGDFAESRGSDVPSIREAADQIRKVAKAHQIEVVFLASDATPSEKAELKSYLSGLRVVHLELTETEQDEYGPGGVAIMDQWICAHARVFLGTGSSTFSMRIEEEREIMGFPPSSTHNCFCTDKTNNKCAQTTHWPVKYEAEYTLKLHKTDPKRVKQEL